MAEDSKAGESRKNFVDSVKGKAKEIAGAVTGRDDLTAEGQLDQAKAAERRAASQAESVAAVEAEQAQAAATQARVAGAQERTAVSAETAAAEQAVLDEQAAKDRIADQAETLEVAAGTTQAEIDARRETELARAEERRVVGEAAEELNDAVIDHQISAEQAADTHAEAERIRRQAAEQDPS